MDSNKTQVAERLQELERDEKEKAESRAIL
jgi:hypothetical protein